MTSPYETGVVGTYPISGDSNIDPLAWLGYKWGANGPGTPAVVTYSFPAAGSTWSTDYTTYLENEPFNSFQAFTAAQQSAAKQALALWSEVANVTFQQVTESSANVGDIRFGNSGSVTNSSAAAWAYTPFTDSSFQYPENGDVWFDVKYAPNLQLAAGQFGFATMLHEIGHAIGLDHPFEDFPGSGEPVLSADLDNDQYTVMSYTPQLATMAYASTPQLLDILAIQYIYGANMTTRTGNDIYKFSASTEVNKTIWDAGGIDTIDLSNQGTSSIISLVEGTYSQFCRHASIGTSSLLGIAYGVTIENATGGSGADLITGNAVANRLSGGSGNDTIDGAGGNDFIDGGAGADTMAGGSGNDVYVVDSIADKISDSGSDADDEVRATISINLAAFGAGVIEHATLLGAGALSATGDAGNNKLTGNDGANVLDGAGGADIMAGGKGADTYIVNEAGDQVIETVGGAAGGIDLVKSGIGFSLAALANVENLTLTGSGNVNATGNALNNVLTGNNGNNRLDGGAGSDTMAGSKGNDTYVVNAVGDIVNETVLNSAGGGVDTVESAITFTLATRTNVENLTLTGSGNINGTGNALANIIIGNSGANILDGGIGADTLVGGAGNDVYVLENLADMVDEGANTDTGDQVKTTAAIATAFAGVENYTYTGSKAWSFKADGSDNVISGGALNDTLDGAGGNDRLLGNAGNDTLVGGIGNDWLEGGLGADKMKGGAGDDTYVVDAVTDTIDEEGNADLKDLVRSSVSVNLMTLGAGSIENAVLLGAAALNATGSNADNELTGNAAANILDGRGGADVMTGGGGADTYVVDNLGDQVVETIAGAAGGVDVVKSGVSFSLAALANVENLTLTGSGNIDATGNGGNNILIGNSGNNRLDGGAGNDTMTGGAGSDTYVVNAAGDIVNETVLNSAGGGVDTVESAITFTLATRANIENLTLTGSGNINGTGNALANVIAGNAGNNILDGGLGADTLKGGAGSDLYLFDNVADIADEEGNTDGSDEVKSSALIAGAFAGIENYTYTGTKAWAFAGTADDNRISGGSGNDTLDGGDGNDTLLGNGGNDTLIGGVGSDWLDGGVGGDKMKGGSGNDQYVIDAVTDTIDEEGNADLDDLVRSMITVNLLTLGAGAIENAILLGTGAINATGNNADNELTGNAGANVLDGRGGVDVMAGGNGGDTYIVDNVGDAVKETTAGAAGGVDLVKSSVSFSLAPWANVENLTLTGSAGINAAGNGLNNVLTGNDGANRLDGGGGNDTMTGGKGGDTYVVNSAGDIVNETVLNSAGGGVDTVESSVTFTQATRTNIEHLTLTGAGNINGTGNALDNHLTGNSGNNVLDGGSGNDTLIGGGGNDTLVGGIGNDLLQGGVGIDKLTGGTGRDTFDFDDLAEAGDTVTDFAKGAAGDVLNLADLLDSFGDPLDAFGGGYLSFEQSGTSTLVRVDSDGGLDSLTTLATLLNVTLTQADTTNYVV